MLISFKALFEEEPVDGEDRNARLIIIFCDLSVGHLSDISTQRPL